MATVTVQMKPMPDSVGKNPIAAGLVLAAALCLASPTTGSAAPAAAEASGTPATQSPTVDEEAAGLAQALRQEVPGLISDTPESAQAWIAYAQTVIAPAGYKVGRPQLLVVVDRNPRVQQMRIVLARPDGAWQSLGGAKVSTGLPRGFEHFLTPTGVFLHTNRIVDWRAEGTYNENHVRGLGAEGMRVWDFGWQRALKGWGPPGGLGKMRLLMHATDPATLERRIGRPASDGCVRIPTAMNHFLDIHGVLDADYERAARQNVRLAALLRPDRAPTPVAGDALVIIDSAGSSTSAPPQEIPNQTSAPVQPLAPAAEAPARRGAKRHAAVHHSDRSGSHSHRRRA
jgi:hypothetical protein